MLAASTALALASVFTGASAYVNFVEQPARLALDDRSMLREWKPSDRRGHVMLGLVALGAAIASMSAFYLNGDIGWLAGALVIIASWPYITFVVTPLDNRLRAEADAGGTRQARGLIVDWGALEWGVTAIGVCAVVIDVLTIG